MRFNKISSTIATLLLLATMGTTTFASTITTKDHQSNRPNLTNEEKTEIKAKREEMNKKWSTLTDAQREKVYKLMEKEIDLKIQTIDEYLTLGLIDKETATNIKSRLTEKKTKIRENDKIPSGKKSDHN